jgi:hypothetical protein
MLMATLGYGVQRRWRWKEGRGIVATAGRPGSRLGIREGAGITPRRLKSADLMLQSFVYPVQHWQDASGTRNGVAPMGLLVGDGEPGC